MEGGNYAELKAATNVSIMHGHMLPFRRNATARGINSIPLRDTSEMHLNLKFKYKQKNEPETYDTFENHGSHKHAKQHAKMCSGESCTSALAGSCLRAPRASGTALVLSSGLEGGAGVVVSQRGPSKEYGLDAAFRVVCLRVGNDTPRRAIPRPPPPLQMLTFLKTNLFTKPGFP